MTNLECCQDLRQEAGISGGDGTPVSVVDQTGEMKSVVDWIAKANQFIQNKHPNWDFLRFDFTFPTIIGVSTYTPTSVSLGELARWKVDTFRCYLTATGVTDEQHITFVPWEIFRDAYLFGSIRTQAGRPQVFTVKPDKSIVTWPVSNALYTIAGEYFKRAQVMTGNTAEPLFPSQFHRVLVWLGLTYYGAKEGAPEVYAHGDTEYKRILRELEQDQLPPIGMAGPLA